ncbi:hypothetical protein [Clostridium perfringens]|uniref:hypothetical protein n=1 Tax=Clostridium perfringens TaxID=1502 RepID=UPI0015715140|nr:hypothetical protein [Clostridium perfringens]MDU7143051.1 hypothetical protein [Anaerococcus vaginalis]MDU7944225.1 hypothetical protein [Streptococcus salivarius]MDU7977630.1 hypothetical protein [Clostridioides difficile]EGS5729014.1 hypothetical protein [Clostridium perfringens]EGT0013605.1 hypothetical protein [Clostridium perfringens]
MKNETDFNEKEFINSYLNKGYKVNGSCENVDMALYLLEQNKKVQLVKRKSRFFGLYSYDDCIVITRD